MMRPVAAIGLLLLVGCSAVPSRPPADDPQSAWQVHRTQLAGIDAWQLKGRLGIQQDQEGWHASIDWQQAGDAYRIHIVGPLGQGAVQLAGDPLGVVMRSADQELYSAEPEELMLAELGWSVPVRSLRYWVLGLPAPGAEARRSLDPQGRLETLVQDGWKIRFLDYRGTAGVELPGKVFAESYHAKVRLVVGEWDLSPPAHTLSTAP